MTTITSFEDGAIDTSFKSGSITAATSTELSSTEFSVSNFATNRCSKFISPISLRHFSKYENDALGNLTPPLTRSIRDLYSKNKLHGRKKEIAVLEGCFQRWQGPNASKLTNVEEEKKADERKGGKSSTSRTQKKRELIWISGVSGCGKTALALTLRDTLLEHRRENKNATQETGFFIRGKFDINLRDQPYAGVISGCNEICSEIISFKNDANQKDLFLDIQRAIILQMGAELPLLLQIIPVLEEITGQPRRSVSSDPTQPSLLQQQSAEECKNRFNYAFRRFIRVIGSFGPLVMFLDDLQWADLGSLELLEVLITDRENSNLMIIGSYRSNEVEDSHPLAKTIREIPAKCDSGGFHITEVTLGNLNVQDVNDLLLDLLSSDDEPTHTKSLADICHTKTHGNAFFLLHFLTMLQHQELLTFDVLNCKWKWDCTKIEEQSDATPNVLDLLKSRMAAMPRRVQQVLVLASCLGSDFENRMIRQLMMELQVDNEDARDTQELASEAKKSVAGEDDNIGHDAIQIAVDNSFLEKLGYDKYRWIHDKIQEAAYSLMALEELAPFQFRVGNALASKLLTEQELDAAIFVVVNLLNAGYNQDDKNTSSAVDFQTNRKLAEMNLKAATKAYSLSAFDSAAKYARKGIEFLPSNRWDDEYYDLTLGLYSTAADSESCIGDVGSMDTHCNEIFEQTNRPIMDKARAYRAMTDRLGNHHRVSEAMEMCRSVLQQMGHTFPRSTLPAVLGTISGFLKYKKKAKTVTDEFISELPLMEDPVNIEAMFFMSQLCKYAYMSESPLLPYTTLRMMKLTFQHGVCQHAPATVAAVGMMLTFFMGDLKAGAVYGAQARKILKKVKHSKSVESHTTFMSCAFVLHMTTPIHDLFKPLLRGYEVGLQVGDIEHAMFNIHYYILLAFQSGKPLPAIETDLRIYIAQMKEFEKGRMEIPCRMLWQVVLNLIGRSEHACALTGLAMDEDDFLKNLSHEKYYLNHYQAYKSQLYAWFGHHECGAEQAMARGALHTLLPGSPVAVTDSFYRAISLFAMARKTKKRKYVRPAKKCLATIKDWSKQGNCNVYHFLPFLEAELAAYHGRLDVAEKNYKLAILMASRAGFAQDAALANERYGEFLLHDVYNREAAAVHLRQAVSLYREWGAVRKIELLQTKYYDLFPLPVQIEVSENIDLASSHIGPVDLSARRSSNALEP